MLNLTLGFCNTSDEFNLGFLQIGIDSESKREYNYEHRIEAMKRYAIEKLKKWKDHPFRKPLLLMGARQVGKTWLMQEFGRLHFKNVAYIRFDNSERARRAFSIDFDIPRLLEAISIEGKCVVEPQNTLIILDEIQECPAALTSLKYFCEEAREYAVVAAGSLLGVADHVGTGFPVGKVDRLNLYPMSFCEFLEATGQAQLATLLQKRDWKLINHFEDLYIRHLRTYLYVGGMPGVVQVYDKLRNFEEVRQAQLNLLRDYREDFSKHAPTESQPRLNMVWDSVPQQLARENKRFVYSDVYDGARRKALEIPLRWLQDAGLIHPVPRIKKPALPMSSYWESGISKVYFLDVGLLSAVSGLDAGTLLDGDDIFSEFKGALAEQFVQQELRATCDLAPCYWASEEKNAKAEVDFLCTLRGNIIPIEVKSGGNLRARSLLVYCQRFQPRHAVRSSLRPYSTSEYVFKTPQHAHLATLLTDLPLYAISQLAAVIE